MTVIGPRGLVLVLVGVLVSATLAAAFTVAFSGPAVAVGVPAPRATPRVSPMNGPSVNVTLHGNAGLGWGLTNATITEPGPNLSVHLGDTVTLTLIGNDSAPHNWFIDYDNNLGPNGEEPSSPDFNTAAMKVVVWSFVADRPGNWTYRCRYHPSSMTGTISILPEPQPLNLTLYANAARGWGKSNATISEPGPPIVVFAGTNVTLTLIANDSSMHNWFIDFDNSLTPNDGEPSSPDFNSGTVSVVVWSFVADRSGNWTYRCRVHPTSMTGSILIIGGTAPPPPGVMLPIISAIMLGALGVVFVFAVIYHVRAVRAAKRMR
ncbi:MAG TPA: hypothetical protein VEO20_08975 [Thermoplasmata archaeon]|nr:hypothetical protein [Thermoplasmata archaeon]